MPLIPGGCVGVLGGGGGGGGLGERELESLNARWQAIKSFREPPTCHANTGMPRRKEKES